MATKAKTKRAKAATKPGVQGRATGHAKAKVIAFRSGGSGAFVLKDSVARPYRLKLPKAKQVPRNPVGFRQKLELAQTASEGMTASEFRNIQEALPLEQGAWAQLLALPAIKKAGGARKPTIKLSTLQAEQVYLVHAAIMRAIEVLEDQGAALKWLITPSDLFRGKAPMDLLTTSTGADLVLDQLVRMEQGVYS